MVRSIAALKSRFQNADHPDGADFIDLIDTLLATGATDVDGSTVAEGSMPVNRLQPGTPYQFLRTANDGSAATWVSVSNTTLLVTQNGHGLTVPDAVYCDTSGNFLKAQANMSTTGQTFGIVSVVLSVDQFLLVLSGSVAASTGDWDARTGGSGGLTPGRTYFLSEAVAGGYTLTPPSDTGATVSPALLATTPSVGFVLSQAASVVGAGGIVAQAVSAAWVNFDGQVAANLTDTFVSGDVDTTDDFITLTAHPFSGIRSVFFTTSNTLPAPLALATLYWLVSLDANTVEVYPTYLDAVNSSNRIDLIDGGTGTHTIDAGQSIRKALNVDHVARLGAGNYQLYFSVPFLVTSYAPFYGSGPSNAQSTRTVSAVTTAQTLTTLTMEIGYENSNVRTLDNFSLVTANIFGPQ